MLTRLLLTLLMVASLCSCRAENQFYVYCIFPEAKLNGVLPKIITQYALSKHRVPIEQNDALSALESFERELTGGMGISGTLTVGDQFIAFTPGPGNSLVASGFSEIKIPIKDIRSIERRSSLVVRKAINLKTANGDIMFVTDKYEHWYNPFLLEDEKISSLISAKMQKAAQY